jgi:hypothetical protein
MSHLFFARQLCQLRVITSRQVLRAAMLSYTKTMANYWLKCGAPSAARQALLLQRGGVAQQVCRHCHPFHLCATRVLLPAAAHGTTLQPPSVHSPACAKSKGEGGGPTG